MMDIAAAYDVAYPSLATTAAIHRSARTQSWHSAAEMQTTIRDAQANLAGEFPVCTASSGTAAKAE